MKSIFLVTISNIKRRKLQNLLIVFSFALASMLFAISWGVRSGMQKPFDQLFDQMNASHLLLFFDHRREDVQKITEWFNNQPEVTGVSMPVPFVSLEDPLIFKGNKIDLLAGITEHHEGNLEQDRVRILKGEKKSHPSMGEIWIPFHLAKSHNIQIGDTIGLPTVDGQIPLAVSAFVADPHYASNLFNPTRIWTAPGSLPFLFPVSQLNQNMLGVRTASARDAGIVWSRFNQSYYFQGKVLSYDLFKSVFLSFYNIISVVLLTFSIMAAVAALIFMYIIISGAIQGDIKLTGILKSLGYTPDNVTLIYLFQYIIIALVALPAGITAGLMSTGIILDSLATSIGSGSGDYSALGTFTLTFVLFFGLVILFSFLIGRRAKKIRPVDAFRSLAGRNNQGGKMLSKAFVFTHIPLLVFIGFRFLASHPKRALFTALGMIITVFILTFSVNVSYSFLQLKENKSAWGFEDADIMLRLNNKIALPLESTAFAEMIKDEDEVDKVVGYSYCQGILFSKDNNSSQELQGKAYEGAFGDIGLTNISGDNPDKVNEIALCVMTAAALGYHVGDSIRMFIEGQTRNFLLTGIYQDVSNLGKGFRMAGAAMKELNPLFEPVFFAVKLKKEGSSGPFKDYLAKKYGETILPELSIEDRKGIRSTITAIRSTLILVSVFFLSIIFAILFNDVLMITYENKRSLGILKTVGFTPAQTGRALVHRILFLTFLSLAIGIPLALALSPALISNVTRGLGLEYFPFFIDTTGTFMIIPGMFFFTGASVWTVAKYLLQFSPKDLMAE